KYAFDVFERVGLTDSKTSTSPLEQNVKLQYDDDELLPNPIIYRRLVDSLVYLTVTCPDIAYVVHLVSQFMVAPWTTHFATVFRILRYIKGTLFYGLQNDRLHTSLFCYVTWARSPSDRMSTTGYCVFVGGNLVSWKSKKQNMVARSSVKSECGCIKL
ncbi:hypothetical protein CFOL_v3_04448, partial [Cephalotus follicularis]